MDEALETQYAEPEQTEAMRQDIVIHEFDFNASLLWSGGWNNRQVEQTKILTQITDKLNMSDPELGRAFSLALEEREHMTHSAPQHPYTTNPEAGNYLYRCVKRDSEKSPPEELYKSIVKNGSDWPDVQINPTKFSAGTPLNNWLFPRPNELEEGIDTTTILVYRNNGLLNTSRGEQTTNERIEDTNKVLRDNFLGAVQIKWK